MELKWTKLANYGFIRLDRNALRKFQLIDWKQHLHNRSFSGLLILELNDS